MASGDFDSTLAGSKKLKLEYRRGGLVTVSDPTDGNAARYQLLCLKIVASIMARVTKESEEIRIEIQMEGNAPRVSLKVGNV